MALVNFKRGNLAAYTAATKSADTLYFVTDEHRIYMGEVPYSGGIYKEVAALPATGEINTIYKVTDTSEGSAVNGDVAYWDGTKYVYLVDMSDIHAKANAYADSLNTAMDSRVATLETAVGSGGSVDSKIQAALEDKAIFLTRFDMDAALAQQGIATPLDYANAKTLMANAGMFFQDGELCVNILAMAEVINALCAQIDTNATTVTPISHGGTGATTKDGARKNLGIATVTDVARTVMYSDNKSPKSEVVWMCRNGVVTIAWAVTQTTTNQWKTGSVGSKYAPAVLANGSLSVASWAPHNQTATAWINSSGDLILQCSTAQSDGRNVGSMTYVAHG